MIDCKKGSPCPHKPTSESRAVVNALYAVGLTQEAIAKRLDIDCDTLVKYYRKELDEGVQDIHVELFNLYLMKAREGNLNAILAWFKMRAGWYEARPPQDSQNVQETPFGKNAIEDEEPSDK